MKTFKFIFALVFVTVLFGGCKYNFIVPEDVIDPNDPNVEEVSFVSDIIPVFLDNNCTACHDPGGQIPDLTAANAYSSINTTRYINASSPAESKLYTRPHPSNTDSHPKYSEAEAALVLTWIQQGAKNN